MRIKGIVDLVDILEYSNDGFFVSDSGGKFLYCNPASDPIMGMDMLQHNSLDSLLKKNLINRSTALEAIQKKRMVTGEVESGITGNRVVATSTPFYDYKGNLEGVICNITDLSAYRRNKEHNYFSSPSDNIDWEYSSKIVPVKGKNYNIELVFSSKVMEEVIELAGNLGKVDSTAILYGETGVGKELIAQYIHNCSPRNKTGPFIKINCASMPVNLFETELFGYEPGSFTGALKNGKKGYFEAADKGTIFLDEIAELPLEVQPKLLSVLEDKVSCRVGGTEARPIDVRIIAATNQDLKKMVEEGKFREDLYFRLNVVPLEIPPLRKRKMEIPMLISYFMRKYQHRYGLKNKEIVPELIQHLYWYPWPGNVRELSNLVERLLIISKGNIVKPSDLPTSYLNYSESKEKFTVHEIAPLKDLTKEFEMTVISKAMEQCRNQKEAAEMLGISFASLSRKFRE